MLRRGFSLVEMVVVLGILTLLLSILMPVVGSARDAANGTLCMSHIRTLTQACVAFAADHDGHLPGSKQNFWNTSNPLNNDPAHLDWLFGKYSMWAQQCGGPTLANLRAQLATAPQYGTLWIYVNNNAYSYAGLPDGGSYTTYLCPSLTTSIPGNALGSNGRFDYAVFAEFDGAAIKDIKPTSTLHYLFVTTSGAINSYPLSPDPRWAANSWSTQYEILPTPLVCQEDAQFNINSNLEGQHAGDDQLAHLHHGGSFYGSPDGTVSWVNEPDVNLSQHWQEGTNLWETVPPSGRSPVLLNTDPGNWNTWAGQ